METTNDPWSNLDDYEVVVVVRNGDESQPTIVRKRIELPERPQPVYVTDDVKIVEVVRAAEAISPYLEMPVLSVVRLLADGLVHGNAYERRFSYMLREYLYEQYLRGTQE